MRVWGRLSFGGTSLVVIVALLLAACGPTPIPTPSPSTSPASPSPSPSAPAAGDLALEACDVTGYVPCEHQAVRLAVPIAGTGAALTYSSEWAPGRKDRRGWDASAIGLGGWSLDILQRYDPAAGVLLSGDGSWRLAKGVTLPSGERAVPTYDGLQVFVFDSKGRHVRTVDGLLGTTLITFSYDADGRLSGADGTLDSAPIHLVVEREADGSLVGLVGLDGARTPLFLDRDGPLGAIRDPAGRTTVFAYASGGLVTEYDDPTGGVTAYGYDDAGRLVSAKDPDGVTVTMARTATADITEVNTTTILGRSATYRAERMAAGVVRSYAAPDGTRTTVSTDPSGQHAVALPDGTKIAVGSQADQRWGMDAPIVTPVDETRPDGVVQHTTTAITTTTPATDPLAVSAWSRTDIVADGTWNETADPASRTITWADPAGRKTTQTYDPAGRMVSQTAPGRPSLAFVYDGHGRLATSTSGSAADAATTTYTYGSEGILTIIGPDRLVEHMTVDSVGEVVRRTAADGSTSLSTYDALGRLVRVAPAGQPSTTIGYSAAGRQTGFLPPTIGADGSYETRTYDTGGRLTAIAGPGDRSIAYTRDAAGRITGWTFDQGTATAAYDPTTGLMVNTGAPGGIETQTTYAGGIPVGRNVAGPVTGAVAVSLDPFGRMAGVSVDGAAPIGYKYDSGGSLTGVGDLSIQRDPASGQVSEVSLGSVRTTREYDAQGRLTHIVAATGHGSAMLDVRYGYDLRGRVTSVTETRGGTLTNTSYRYDDPGRLAEVSVNGISVGRYGYDAAGNRVAVKTPSGTLKATYDDRDRLLSWGAARYVFQPDGQLASITVGDANTDFRFDDFGVLRAVTLPDGRRIDYLVDAGGARIGKRIDGTLVNGYLYRPDGALAAQTDRSGAVVAQFGYDDAGRLTLVERGGTRYQVITDRLGSPLLVIDAGTGAVAEAIAYDAWGAVTSDTNPGFIPIGFAGGLRDVDTGLVRFGAREYDPRTGRWTGPDPIGFTGGDPVLYRYVAGDPVNRTDATGLRPSEPDWYFGSVKRSPDVGITGSAPPAPPPPPAGGAPFTCIGMCTMPNGTTCFGYCHSGEPHERTGDGVPFEFQGAGEFQMVASPDRRVVIQARMEPLGASTRVTLGTAVAASVDGDRVAVYASDKVPLTIGGKPDTRADLSVRLPHGGIVERHGPVVTILWPSGGQLDVSRAGSHLDFSFDPDPTMAPTLRGLLGSADGDPANDFTARDGTVLAQDDPAFAAKLYDPFGTSWRISQSESLFDYGPGRSTATFTKPEIPTGPATIDGLDATTRRNAEALCRAMGVTLEPTLTNCILDVGITGDPSYAASAAAVQVSTATAAAPLPGPTAGSFSGMDQKVSGTISQASQVDRTPFTAKAGDVVFLDAQGACVPGLQWQLVGPSGKSLGLDYLCFRDLGRIVLPEAGTYTVEVNWDKTTTGAYAFEIIGAPVERTTAYVVGQVVSDTTTRIGEWHRYTFTAKAGDTVFADAQGACVDGLLWSLVGPSGRITLGTSCTDLGPVVLPLAGLYAVEVYSDGTATGAYAFQVRAGP
jgi:RHS repeat-associated protein